MKIIFFYTNLPFWRAEVSRLALFLGNVEFEDYRMSWPDDFKEMIKTGKLPNGSISPFRQIPVIEVDGKIIAQTAGIARFCGKLSGLYPKNDDLLAASIDQIIDAANEITTLISLTMKYKDENEKKNARKKLSEITLPKWLGFLEELLRMNKPSNWFAGNSMSIADIAIWRLIGWIISGKIEHVPKSIIEAFPNLKQHYDRVNSLPKVREWMQLKYNKYQ